MQKPHYDRTWEYRFFDKNGLIGIEHIPPGVDVRLPDNEEAWRVADRLKEDGIHVVRIEREDPASGGWVEVPVL